MIKVECNPSFLKLKQNPIIMNHNIKLFPMFMTPVVDVFESHFFYNHPECSSQPLKHPHQNHSFYILFPFNSFIC